MPPCLAAAVCSKLVAWQFNLPKLFATVPVINFEQYMINVISLSCDIVKCVVQSGYDVGVWPPDGAINVEMAETEQMSKNPFRSTSETAFQNQPADKLGRKRKATAQYISFANFK